MTYQWKYEVQNKKAIKQLLKNSVKYKKHMIKESPYEIKFMYGKTRRNLKFHLLIITVH